MKIVLAITGSISAYKTYDLVREFVKAGHEIKVILSRGAQKFILPDTFFYLGAMEVYCADDDFNLVKNQGKVLHIELKNWMDQLLIAPASANTLARLANGICDDLLGCVFTSNNEKPIIIFPAMNTKMLENPMTNKNLTTLKSLINIFIHPPKEGVLICNEEGAGKLPDIQTIFDIATTYPQKIINRKILITTGPTNVPIDPVRYITNPSSGKTGHELSKQYLSKGCEVILIHGPNCQFPTESLIFHPRYTQISVTTTEEMYQEVNKYFDLTDVYISSAAISDLKFQAFDHKWKKNSEATTLQFEWSTDILKKMIEKKSQQKIVSFAAETNDLANNFRKKWNSKPVDLLIGNQVHNGKDGMDKKGFGTNQNDYYLIKNGEIYHEQSMSKKELANMIYQFTEASHD